MTADVEEVLQCGVVEDAPSFATEHKRLGNLRMLVGCPHAQYLATVLYVLAAGAATAVEALSLTQGEVDDAALLVFAGLGSILGGSRGLDVADNTIVLCHLHVGKLHIDVFAQRGEQRVGALEVVDAVHYLLARLVGHADRAVLLVDGQGVESGGDSHHSTLVGGIAVDALPVFLLHIVAQHEIFGILVTRREAYAEDAVRTYLHVHVHLVLQLYLVLGGVLRHHGDGCQQQQEDKQFFHDL